MAVVEQVMVVAAERVAQQAGELHRVEPDLLDEPEDVFVASTRPARGRRRCAGNRSSGRGGTTVICVESRGAAEVGVVVFFEARIEHERVRATNDFMSCIALAA